MRYRNEVMIDARRLLAALGAGILVFATEARWLGMRPGVTMIPPDDVSVLIAALMAGGRTNDR